MCFRCYSNLKFPLTYNGKSENWHLLPFHCRDFDKTFSEMFVEWSPTKHLLFDQTAQFDWLSRKPKGYIKKEYTYINQLLRSYMGYKAEILIALVSKKTSIFYCCCMSTFVTFATQSFHRLTMGKMKIGFNGSLIAGIFYGFY